MRVLFYAVNGQGVGHLTRTLAVARWMRRYARFLGEPCEILFLTTSEADSLLFHEGFPSWKLPSKTSATEAGLDPLLYRALAKQWIASSVGLVRPDLLVVDTFPRGSFGELPFVLDLCRASALISRPKRADYKHASRDDSLSSRYDLILIPEYRPARSSSGSGNGAPPRLFVGPIASREPWELLSRTEARMTLGIEGSAFVVYVSAGGGGDPDAGADLAWVLGVLRTVRDVTIVVGAGPLYRGPVPRGPGIVWLGGESAACLMRAFDVAISAAGYNAWTELLLAGVPTIFVPQAKGADDQAERAERAARAGAARVVQRYDDGGLRAAFLALASDEERDRTGVAARALVPRSHARDAASELLRLVLDPSRVGDADEVLCDEFFQHAAGAPASEEIVSMAGLLAKAPPPLEPRGELAQAAHRLFRELCEAGLGPELRMRWVSAWSRKAPALSAPELVDLAVLWAHRLAPFGDWSSALHLLMRSDLSQPELEHRVELARDAHQSLLDILVALASPTED